jgi:hypothetical protein
MANLSPRLERRVRADFGAGATRVLAELAGVPETLPGCERQDPERIQAALVIAAHGDAIQFAALMDLARLDWRDVLLAADLADGDWKARLDRELASP